MLCQKLQVPLLSPNIGEQMGRLEDVMPEETHPCCNGCPERGMEKKDSHCCRCQSATTWDWQCPPIEGYVNVMSYKNIFIYLYLYYVCVPCALHHLAPRCNAPSNCTAIMLGNLNAHELAGCSNMYRRLRPRWISTSTTAAWSAPAWGKNRHSQVIPNTSKYNNMYVPPVYTCIIL